MVVFNTKAGSGPSNGPPDVPPGAVAAFNPSAGSWKDLARCPITDFTYASVVWTGRQLIVVKMGAVSGGTEQMQVLS